MPRKPESAVAGPVDAIFIPTAVHVRYGSTALALTKPDDATLLHVFARKGDWSVRAGDVVASMPAAYLAGASVTDGTAGWPVKEHSHQVLAAHTNMTIKGYAADSELVYFWA